MANPVDEKDTRAVSEATEGRSRSKTARGIRPRPSWKPTDPETGKPIKRTEFTEAFGKRLKAARVGPDEANPRYQINDVVDALSVITGHKWNRQTLNAYENGYAVPPVEKLVVLCDFYHASLDYIVRGQEASAVHIEQMMDKLPWELRVPLFAIYKDTEIGKAVLAISEQPDAKKGKVLEIVDLASKLTTEQIQVLHAMAVQLAGITQ